MTHEHKHYDAIIVGGGKAGKTLAMDLARQGKKVAMIEAGMIGGTCINVACIPTKTMVASAKVTHAVNEAQSYGVNATFSNTDLAKVIERKQKVVDGMRAMNLKQFQDSGMDFFIGQAHFVGPKTIEVHLTEAEKGTAPLQMDAERVFINTGALPFMPALPGLSEIKPLTNAELMELKHIPAHLLIMGGGYIGLEFGQMFRRFGSQVTLIERSPDFLPLEDRDVAASIKEILEKEGITILLNQEVIRAEGSEDQPTLILREVGQTQETALHGSKVLVSVGRVANTKILNLDSTGVKTDARGFIEVNEFLETNVPGIWAMGDVKGGAQFTHVSLDDYRILKANLDQPVKKRSTKERLVPYTVFIDPELARFGLTETQARQKGLKIKIAKLPVSAIPRAKTIGKTTGFLKAIIDADTQHILGVAFLCEEAGEMLAAVQVVMNAQLPYTILRDTMFSHPTLCEGFNQLFADSAIIQA